MNDTNAIFVGGPCDGELFAAEDAALVEVEIDGLLHRYLVTPATRDSEGGSRRIYNYDGEIRGEPTADGVQSGSSGERVLRLSRPVNAQQ
ncbi:hypothetical protein [Actinoplanes teichomyceticus]|uniref:Uncharacterized protein n=1 Tax=Actinoplanes teichomyceticus TaxID=1867 RepID=A0A561VFZ3_ACTTI|nr:hypothetical protein [Actinoplanes teichomyceticus]TWG10521.1 hypothetical protein FHX34_10711 [Actinoplanes teichomyceticus]GIF15292.1 hypothetical protein Ate01nite_53240 [Actinoplanes teichomyceticus]